MHLFLLSQVNTTHINKIWRTNCDVENKIPGVSGLVTTAALNKKIGKVEKKIPDNSVLVNKFNIFNLVKKYDLNKKLAKKHNYKLSNRKQ